METLSAERLKEAVNYDPLSGVFTNRKTGTLIGSKNKGGYMHCRVGGSSQYLHRLAWLYYFGSFPKDNIDHINGDRSDNRICNLREATRSQNNRNRRARKDNACGVKGVRFCRIKGKWAAHIFISGRRRRIGYFNSMEEAGDAYKTKADEHFGEFANY